MYLNNHSQNDVSLRMKKLIYLFTIIAGLVLSGCDQTSCPTCPDDWNNNKIHGSGNITTVAYDLPMFHLVEYRTKRGYLLPPWHFYRWSRHT